ncbi:hypothetical protein THAOC_09391 [Thalassiosira oceanica]|uniref:Ion transport domain-containing protein n=1 Tax=Thalassiosira oceanica TaxID=159749 RepID=K0SVA3_THAOC|nr:hypothetical protein THAOC_09391 [Thalassiosira oceanica]|eukprot:EJK69360.1 hypothetical protein THAOC_09391 [Thalassiosira oceanica]
MVAMVDHDDPAVREGGDSELEESNPDISGSELQAACRDKNVSVVAIRGLVSSDPESRDRPDNNLESPLQVYLRTCRGSYMDPNPEIVKLLATHRAVNMRGHSGKTALCVLGSMASRSFGLFRRAVMFFGGEEVGSEPDKANYFQTMDIILSNNPTASKSSFLDDLLFLPKDMRVHSFMNSNTRNAINNSLGRAPYMALLMSDLYVQLLIVGSFVHGCYSSFSRNVTAILLAGSAYSILRRTISLWGSSMHSLPSSVDPHMMMSLLQAGLLITVAMYARQNNASPSNEELLNERRSLFVATAGLCWMNMMAITCHISRGFSTFIQAMIRIFKELAYLAAVGILVIFSFASMFYLSSVGYSGYCTVDGETCSGEDCEPIGNYCSMPSSVSKLYTLFFGTLEVDDFDVPFGPSVLLFFYNMLVTILLLNIIIAVMSTSFESVQIKGELIFWDHRFELIHDVNSVIRCVKEHTSFFRSFFPKRNAGLGPSQPREVSTTATAPESRKSIPGWYSTLLRLEKGERLPSPIVRFIIAISIAAWVIAGLLTLGVVWPRRVRQKLFSADAPCEIEGRDGSVVENDEIVRLKVEVELLREQLGALK